VGTLNVGKPDGANGPELIHLVLAGGSRTRIELQGASGVSSDRVVVSGAAILAGTLDLVQLATSPVGLGQSWDVILAGSIAGRFDGVGGVSAGNGLLLATVYLPDRVRVAAALPGDADLDRTVDSEDFRLLYQHFGEAGAGWAEGDFDGDGQVSMADFQILERGFGLSGVSAPAQWREDVLAAAVPEPGGCGLVMLGVGAVLRRRRGRVGRVTRRCGGSARAAPDEWRDWGESRSLKRALRILASRAVALAGDAAAGARLFPVEPAGVDARGDRAVPLGPESVRF